MKRTLIIVRTHRADEPSIAAYERFQEVRGAEVVFCVDERAGEVDMGLRPKIGWNLPLLRELGLFAHPDAGWQCGDYCYHVTRHARPEFDYYWLIEPDVRIHTSDLNSFFVQFDASDADLLAPRFGPRNGVWWWTRTISKGGLSPHGCLFPITRLSGQAIDHVFEVRKTLSLDPAIASRESWPNDESITASALASAKFVCSDLNSGRIICHTQQSLGAGAIVDYDVVSASPPDGLIYHPVRDFGPWLERAEARISSFRRGNPEPAKLLQLRAEASYLGSVGRACLRHPTFSDSSFVPHLLAYELWSARAWAAASPQDHSAADLHEAAVVKNRLDRRFAPNRRRDHIATAYVVARPQARDRLTTVAPTDFQQGDSYSLGAFPRNVALPFAYDFSTSEMIFTLHITLTNVFAAPFLYNAQREMTRVIARVPADRLVEIYGPRDTAAAPILIFSLGRTGSTLLEKLIGCLTPRSVSEPDVLTQLATSRAAMRSLAVTERQDLIYYALAPLFTVQIPDADGARCVIKMRSQVNGLSAAIAETFPAAKYVFMVRERRAWARSTYRSFRLTPNAVVERLLQGLHTVQTLRQKGVDLDVIAYEDMIADPHSAIERFMGVDLRSQPALSLKIAQVMAEDSQADHRLSRTSTSKTADGEDAWMASFEELWNEMRPVDLIKQLGLDF